MSTAFGVISFLLVVNSLPVLMQAILGEFLKYPVDGGLLWLDNKPLFGQNKTIRGVVVSIAGGIGGSGLLGQPWWTGGVVAIFCVIGDLTSSFIKRRLNVSPGSNFFPLDHLFESLFPVLSLLPFLSLDFTQVFVIVCSFILVAYPVTLCLKYITHRTQLDNYPRIIRSTVRLRQWRSCHIPLARYQNIFNLNHILSDQIVLSWLFKMLRIFEEGKKNALDIRLQEKNFTLSKLPQEFDGFRILFIADFHLDGLDGLTDKLIDVVRNIEVDLCLLGGDIRMKLYGPILPSIRELRKVIPYIQASDGVLGVLGNHDCIEMIPDLEEAGVVMLVNEAWPIARGQSRIWVAGVDDPHYYKLDDARQACRDIPDQAFTIFLAHSPEAYKKASLENVDLYLCGHTHGGQICFPDQRPVITNSRAPRHTSAGEWRFKEMLGYTTRGIGASSIPLRFNCPGEVCLITLHRVEEKEGKGK